MAAPKLSTVQGLVIELIVAAAAKTGSILAGIPIARDGFGYMDPDAENAPDKIIVKATTEGGPGLAIYVSYPVLTRRDSTVNGTSVIKAIIPVILGENPRVNQVDAGGLNRDPLQVVEAIWAAVKGRSNGPQSFDVEQTPMGTVVDGQGDRIYQLYLECPILVG